MRILLLGENSGLYRYLKQGLLELGHDVTFAADGDGWKKISGYDIPIYTTKRRNSIAGKIDRYIVKPIKDTRFSNYDIVQVVSPGVFYWSIIPIMFKKLKRTNKRVFLSISGLSPDMYNYWKNNKYGIYYQMFYKSPELLKDYESKSLFKSMRWKAIDVAYKSVDGLIPVIPFEYEKPYSQRKNIRKAITLPVNVNEIQYKPNIVNDKIVFFHGINSYESKGSEIIINAMKKIEEKYNTDVECIVADRMPYNEYLDTINKANVIIDQCKSYGYGMNACISLAKGKLVMSGAEKQVFETIPKEECPIYNILPEEDQIFKEMERIIADRNNIEEIGERGRKYIEKYHDHVSVAKQYIKEWNS